MALRHTAKLFQDRGNRITTAPAVEPVTVEEMKTQLRIDGTDEDAFLEDAITEARQEIEDLTSLALITQSWQLTIDRWPNGREPWWDGTVQAHINTLSGVDRSLDMPRFPLQSITTVTTFDEAGNSAAVVVADTFDIDTQQLPGRLTLKSGATWPTALRDTNAIEIVYVAGYGDDAADVPAPLKRAIKNVVGYIYSHRGDDCDVSDALAGVMGTIDRYRVRKI